MNRRDPAAGITDALSRQIPDVQASVDNRRQPIGRVGVRGLRYPMTWRDAGRDVPTVATWHLYVALPAEQKGTHMSRFIALLEEAGPSMSLDRLATMHGAMLRSLEAESGRIELRFALFLKKSAPVSGVQSTLDYELSLSIDGDLHRPEIVVGVVVPVTSLCPCSKSVSEYGAHNQRSHVTVTARMAAGATLEASTLIQLVERQASCELYGLLKRVDEKFVTERAYDNPKFVEDLVRDVAAACLEVPGLSGFVVEAENFESIHNHSAYARIEAA
jgi:GTP cyclohydrolase IB